MRRTAIIICCLLAGVSALTCRTNVAEALGKPSNGSTCVPTSGSCFWTNGAEESYFGQGLGVKMNVVYGCDEYEMCSKLGAGVTVTDGITVNCCSEDSCNVRPANVAPNLKCRTNVAEARGMTSIGSTDTCGPNQNCFWTNGGKKSAIGQLLHARMDVVYGCDVFGICPQVGMGVTVTDGISVNCCDTDSCNTSSTVFYASGLLFLLASLLF